MKLERLEYIDALRGFMILMVVYVHLITLNIGMNTECGHSIIIDVFSRFRMPLFFSITGFFAYGKYDLSLLKRRLSNRIKKQLWPTILIGTVLVLIVGDSLYNFIFDDSKSGYWFTYCLVQVWLVYAIIACALNYMNLSQKQILIIMVSIAFFLLPLSAILQRYFPSIQDEAFFKILSLSHTIYLSPFFFIGVAIRMTYHNLISRIMNKEFLIIITLIILFSGMFIMDSHIFVRAAEVTGVLFAYILFYHTRSFWEGNYIFSRSLRFLGKSTLVIYLFHYYIIYFLRKNHLTDSLHPVIGNNWLELPIIFSLAFIVSFICVGIDYVLKRNKTVHRLVFGS